MKAAGAQLAAGRAGATAEAVFETRAASFSYPDARAPAVDGVTLRVERADVQAVLGPNGSGKSTLLKLLAGVLPPATGEVLYRGRPAGAWNRRSLARELGVVAQAEAPTFAWTVRELVAMARYPHVGWLGREGPDDRRAVDEALSRCDLTGVAERSIETLSGGERQRARVARALAQRPHALLLDEPTLSLDVQHEMAIFELLAALPAEGVTVVLATHNLNLAARFANRLVFLHRGRVAAEGAPAEVLTPSLLEGVYAWPVRVQSHPGPGADAGAPQVVPLSRRRAPAAQGD